MNMYVPMYIHLHGSFVILAPKMTERIPKKASYSSFRMYFDRGDLPIRMEYLCGGDKIGWTVRILSISARRVCICAFDLYMYIYKQ